MFRSVTIVQDMLSNLCDSLVFSILRPRTRNLEMTFEARRQLLLQQIRCAPVKVNDELRTLEPQTMTLFSSDSQFPKTPESKRLKVMNEFEDEVCDDEM
jgi:hypothetical protein